MELRDYLNVISARRHLIVIATFIVAVVALAVSLVQAPAYEAEAKVLISERDTGAALFGLTIPDLFSQPERALQTEVQLVKVRPIMEQVIKQLGLKLTPRDLADRVKVSAIGQTNVIMIVAEAPTADQAAEIANAMAGAYVTASQERKRASLKEAADEVEDRLSDARADILELGRRIQQSGKSDELEAELRIATDTYSTLTEKLQQLRINERLESGSGSIVQGAVPSDRRVRPRSLRNTGLGLLVGLIFGTAMAFLYEYLDNTIKSTDEAEKIYQAPVLSIIPAENLEKGKKRRLVIVDAPGSASAEAYRVLRNSIDFVNFEHDLKTVLVASATPSEGKSTVSANLAASLAQAGKKVVLVSSDFRRPTTDQFFQVNNIVGLSDVLLGTHSLKAAMQQPTSDQLLVLTAGKMPPNPSELLGSIKMEEVIASLKEWADWIIIDSPPILAVADPISMARWVDGVLLVSRAGESTKGAALKAVELLGKVGGRIIGVAVWGLDESRNRLTYGYGYGYGHYTGGYYYYHSYYGYSPKPSRKKQSGQEVEEADWVSRASFGRRLAEVLARVMVAVLGLMMVLAICLVLVYLLDGYFGWGYTEIFRSYLPQL